MTDGAEAVVGFNRLLELVGIHAGRLGETVKRVGLEGPAGLDGGVPFLVEVRKLRADRNHDADAEVNARVLHHMVERRLVIDDEHRAADAFEGVAGKRPFEHDLFVAEAFALRREPEVRLLGGGAHVIGRAHAARTRTIGGLHFGAFLAGAHGPGHADAVARLTRLGETVGVREAEVFLGHFLVGEEPARGDDRGLGVNRDLVARLVRGFHAHDAAVFRQKLFTPGVEEKLLSLFLVLLLEEIDPASAAAFIDVPGVEAVRIVREELFELHAVFHHPVDGVGRLVDEGANHLGIAAPVTIVHDLLESLVLREAVVPVALHLAFDGEDAFGELARAARHGGLFERDHVEVLFGGGPGGGRTRSAGTDHDDVGLVFLIGGPDGRHGERHGRGGQREMHFAHG